MNIKNENLSFEEYFLFFANFSHLIVVKFQTVTFQRGVSPTNIKGSIDVDISKSPQLSHLFCRVRLANCIGRPLSYLELGLLIAPPTYSLHLSPLSDPLEQARRVASLHSFICFNQLFPETFCIL